MSRAAVRCLLVLGFLAPAAAKAGGAWDQLRIGMTDMEAEAILGRPLLRSVGQDYAVWIYDHRAELVFYGPLIAWSAPSEGPVRGRVVDVWQVPAGGGGDGPAFFLPKPTRALPAAERRVPVAPEWRSAFRYGR